MIRSDALATLLDSDICDGRRVFDGCQNHSRRGCCDLTLNNATVIRRRLNSSNSVGIVTLALGHHVHEEQVQIVLYLQLVCRSRKVVTLHGWSNESCHRTKAFGARRCQSYVNAFCGAPRLNSLLPPSASFEPRSSEVKSPR